MAKVLHYVPEVASKFICSKGGLHAEEPLNLVCLDPLCRNDPLGCPICFVNIHKHHRVVSIDKFIDDYTRNVKESSSNKAMKKIQKHHGAVKDLISNLRAKINNELDNFSESIDEYADELRSKTNMRQYISKSLGISLEPSKIKQNKSNEQLKQFLKFVLNNSLFDKSNNMINISDILKKDEQRIYALLDQMVNMTEHCQDYIKEVMKSLSFSDNIIKQEKVSYQKQLNAMKINKDQFDLSEYGQTQTLHKTLQSTIHIEKEHWHQQLYSSINPKINQNVKISPQVKFTFNQRNKHQMIEVKNNAKIGISNITALKPQYALLTPQLSTLPTEVKQWVIKINNCRNFASENTMAIGLATLSELKNSNFEGHYPKNALLLTSQGYVIQNGESRKTNVIFGSGDTLHCRYDPFYKLLQINKENGRKLTLKVDRPQNEDLFVCVRLTYASDQVQIL